MTKEELLERQKHIRNFSIIALLSKKQSNIRLEYIFSLISSTENSHKFKYGEKYELKQLSLVEITGRPLNIYSKVLDGNVSLEIKLLGSLGFIKTPQHLCISIIFFLSYS